MVSRGSWDSVCIHGDCSVYLTIEWHYTNLVSEVVGRNIKTRESDGEILSAGGRR